MPEETLVGTAPSDAGENYSQVVLPVPPHRLLLMSKQSDGSLVLRPTETVIDEQAQHYYDTDPELRKLLKQAAEGPRVRKNYVPRGQ